MIKHEAKSPWDRAVKYISYKMRTEKEVREYLGEECTEEIIAKLKDYKFINDEEYARMYANDRARFRPRSQKMLNFELKRKGLPPVEIDDLEMAKAALVKKKNLKSREQTLRFLQSRGFSWGTIAKVLPKAYNTDDVN